MRFVRSAARSVACSSFLSDFPQNTNMAQPACIRTAPDGRTAMIENLAPQIISGVIATGQRYTTKYPPGTFNNNDKEIVTVNERWMDPKTGVVILTKNTGLMANGTISFPIRKKAIPTHRSSRSPHATRSSTKRDHSHSPSPPPDAPVV